MGEVQLWQADGLGTDKETLEKVLHIFRSDGVQGIESQQALNRYIQKLDDNCIREMDWIDAEATLQMLVDCYGVTVAFQKYVKAEGFIKQEKWIVWAGSVQKHTGKWSASMRNARKS